MNDADIEALATRAGIAVDWTDYAGVARRVAPPTLQHILEALGLPCGSDDELAESRHRLDRQGGAGGPPVLAGVAEEPLKLPLGSRIPIGEIRLESGEVIPVRDVEPGEALPVISAPGRHRLVTEAGETILIVAPGRCLSLSDVAPHERVWGLVAQIYSLTRRGDCGIGDMAGVIALAHRAAATGADALALSPNHALFFADPTQYSPYSPSSRLFRNPLYADPAAIFGAERAEQAINKAGVGHIAREFEQAVLIDYPRSAAAKTAWLRTLYADFRERRAGGEDALHAKAFDAFRREQGALLEKHARFEALHAARLSASPNDGDWRKWPPELRLPDGPAVEIFAAEYSQEVEFQAFLQWLADASAAAAQNAARQAGMRIGLISDLAVGMSPAGSHAWSRQEDLLVGLQIGAPPDLINQVGQNWGLTGFSPRALSQAAFEPFAATLRATMRHAGGIRIDHVMGLRRLWLIPDGASAKEGAYVSYPFEDLACVIALKSHRHRAIVVAEDLGTVPEGFRGKLTSLAMYGMNVLWFERWGERFTPARDWPRDAAAMTTTHDLPTLAGWWAGYDIELRASVGFDDAAATAAAIAARAADRAALWSAMRASDPTAGDQPSPSAPDAFVDHSLASVASTPSRLALFPLEDVLGLKEQPNLPGAVTGHPNWRRRLAQSVDAVLDPPRIEDRLKRIATERKA